MGELSKEQLIGDDIELDQELIDQYPLIQPTLFVEFNPADKHIMQDPSQRAELLSNMFLSPVKNYGNEIPFVQYLYQNNIKVAMSLYPSDRKSAEMADVYRLLDKWNVVSEFWIGLDDEDGCYINPTNLKMALKNIEETIFWGAEIGIDIHTLGIDLEPSIKLMKNPDFRHLMEYTGEISNVRKTDIEYFNKFTKILSNYGIKINQYRGIMNIGSSKKIEDRDKSIKMYYTSIMPSFLQNILIKSLYNPNNEVVATGIIERGSKFSENQFYTPGRLFQENKTNHLTNENLYRDIKDSYIKYLKNKTKPSSDNFEMYFFALDHPEVATVVRNTINKVQNDVFHG